MSFGCFSSFEARYLDSCKRHSVLPKSAILSWLHKALVQKCDDQKCTIVVFLDQLEEADLPPLIDVFVDTQYDAVNLICESPCVLSQESVLSLMHATSLKLQVVDLRYTSFAKEILCKLFQDGLDFHILNLKSKEAQSFNIAGSFMLLHTLILDFCSTLTSLKNDYFAHMPNLRHLSMCGTRVANLWTTSAALSRLNSLVELRFQNCVCCKDTRRCPSSSKRRDLVYDTTGASYVHDYCISGRDKPYYTSFVDRAANSSAVGDSLSILRTNRICQNSVGDRIIGRVSDNWNGISMLDLTSDASLVSIKVTNLQIQQVSRAKLDTQDESQSPTSVLNQGLTDSSVASRMYDLEHASPICFEKHYREYMITTLPCLQVLDNLPITAVDREMAKAVFSMHFEYLPYKHQYNESIIRVLHKREIGTSSGYCNNFSRRTQSSSCQKSQIYYSRSLCAAKLGSCAFPDLLPMSHIGHRMKEGRKSLHPRQFEYHPSDSSLMAFGTLDGEVVVINHEQGKIFNYIPPFKPTVSALALCWLHKSPSKLLAGFDNGSLRLYDINQVLPKGEDSSTKSYNDFEKLTSVHVNSMDDKFLASSYSRKLSIYDVCSGRRLQLFTDIHQEAINVAKFAHQSPHLLVTSSYDRDVKMWDLRQKPIHPCYAASSSRGNVMVCFSPDDLYLLVSAVDNEVKQLLAVDGRLHTRFEIDSTGSLHNYTRSYYMNGRDYIISGSCEESVVRICCGQTGRRLRDIYLEDRDLECTFFVQSLRSDPFRHFHMAILAASGRPSSPLEIVKVNMLASQVTAKLQQDDKVFTLLGRSSCTLRLNAY